MRLTSLFKKKYIPLNTIEVSAAAIKNNYEYLQKSSGLAIAPAIKSNAYGHGLVATAKMLDAYGSPFFCVDSIYEAYELLKAKIKTPVLIMGYVNPENLAVKKLPFSYAVSTLVSLDGVLQFQPQAGIHIFVDTGMHREGFPMESLPGLLQIIKKKKIHIEGLMSHFAAADNNNAQTKQQVRNFQKAQEMFEQAGVTPKWIHMANSLGVLYYHNYKGKIGTMARPGIAIYGVDPSNNDKKLQPAMQFSSTLVQIKQLLPGESTGYDFTFTAKKKMKIGIVSAGYNDGVDRRLSNNGYMKIDKTFCKIIGNVSMNVTVIDISEVKNPKIGDQVIVYSNNPKDKNSISEAALECITIPYVHLVGLATSTKRVVV